MPRHFLRWALPLTNVIACGLFAMLREPVLPEYLAKVDAVHRSGGVLLNSGLMGMLACRHLYSWSDWHGGEALGVKILEVVNAPALGVAAFVSVVGDAGVARMFSACAWSWVLAGVVVVVATMQWWLVGVVLDNALRRLRRRMDRAAQVSRRRRSSMNCSDSEQENS